MVIFGVLLLLCVMCGVIVVCVLSVLCGDLNCVVLCCVCVVFWDVDGMFVDSIELGFSLINKVLCDVVLCEIMCDEYLCGMCYIMFCCFVWYVMKNVDDVCGEVFGAAFDDVYVAFVTTTTVGFYFGIVCIVV